MTIDKAIETLQAIQHTGNYQKSLDDTDAIKLGIEAMKRINAWRNDNNEDLMWDLEGETKE